ncbi:MAG TPA: hypothetical protein VEA35_17905 [Ramlibacter sp.]|nr:hypothetical protein [Ramlibacter sp.]
MHLVQIILPLYDNEGRKIDAALYRDVKELLVQRFGGVTAFTRAPAEGLWQQGDRVQKDEVLLYEVMVESVDPVWWTRWRQELEARFGQQELVVRAHPIELF